MIHIVIFMSIVMLLGAIAIGWFFGEFMDLLFYEFRRKHRWVGSLISGVLGGLWGHYCFFIIKKINL